MPLPDVDEKAFSKILAMKQSTMSSVLTAAARMRPDRLRPQNDDSLSSLLALVRGDDSDKA